MKAYYLSSPSGPVALFPSFSSVPPEVLVASISGLVAGLVLSPISSPLELLKCQQQVERSPVAVHFFTRHPSITSGGSAKQAVVPATRSLWELGQHIYHTYGMRHGLMAGFGATVLRTVPGNALFFGSFEALLCLYPRKNEELVGKALHPKITRFPPSSSLPERTERIGTNETPTLVAVSTEEDKRQDCRSGRAPLVDLDLTRLSWMLAAGCFAGTFSWLAVYPFDVIKTQQQTHLPSTPQTSFSHTFRRIYAQQGWSGMYVGAKPTLLRSLPVNMVYLPSYYFFQQILFEEQEE